MYEITEPFKKPDPSNTKTGDDDKSDETNDAGNKKEKVAKPKAKTKSDDEKSPDGPPDAGRGPKTKNKNDVCKDGKNPDNFKKIVVGKYCGNE